MAIKLNLGSGSDNRTGFINVDIQKFPGVNVKANALQLPLPDCSVDFVVAQHLLEYIPRSRTIHALSEWFRILKPGGVLEIRTTNLTALTKNMYLNTISPEMGLPSEMVISLLYGKQGDAWDLRYCGFTPEYLQGMLTIFNCCVTNIANEDMDFILTIEKR